LPINYPEIKEAEGSLQAAFSRTPLSYNFSPIETSEQRLDRRLMKGNNFFLTFGGYAEYIYLIL
jgi:hypothetical protein